MKTTAACLWLLFMAIAAHPAMAQKAAYRAYTTVEGLPHDNVFALAQDPYGFVWVGTELGMARFNGQHFQHFGRAQGLPGNIVSNLVIDTARNILWVGCHSRGVAAFALHQGSVTFLDSLRGKMGVEMHRAHGRITVTFKDRGIYALELKKGRIAATRLALPGLSYGELYPTPDSSKWVYNHESQYRLLTHTANGEWVADSTLVINLHCMLGPTRQGQQWMGVKGGIRPLGPQYLPGPLQPVHPQAIIREIIPAGPGRLWLISTHGHLYHWQQGHSTRADTLYTNGQPKINELLQDQAGGLWLGTYGHGLLYLNPTLPITTYTAAHGLPSHYVQTVKTDPFRHWVWVGTVQGLAVLDHHNLQPIHTPASIEATATVRDILPTPGNVWVGITNVNSITTLTHQNTPVALASSTSLLPIGQDSILLAGWTSHGYIHKNTNGHWQTVASHYPLHAIKYGRSNSFYVDSAAGRLWLNHKTGLFHSPWPPTPLAARGAAVCPSARIGKQPML